MVGDTLVELNDYLKSPYFDDLSAFSRRSSPRKLYDLFPAPASEGWFLASWCVVLLLSVAVATRHTIFPWVHGIFLQFGVGYFSC